MSTTPIPPDATAFIGNPSAKALKRLFLILTLAACGMAALLALFPAAGHDQIWFLMMSERWLAGAQLYGPQIFDSNPPGIVWLSAIPVLLGHTLHIPATLAAKILVTLLETAASLLSLFFLNRTRPTQSYEIPALLFAAITLFYVVPARDFGQRDHLVAFLILPYILAAILSYRDYPLIVARFAAAILGGVGICLKPHYALIPVAVELTLLIAPNFLTGINTRRNQLFRPEVFLLVAVGTGFLLAIHHLAPLYFSLALPILHDTYWAIGHLSFFSLCWEAIELLILAAISIALTILIRRRSPIVLVLQISAAAATVAYFIQGTGWYYQQLPAISLFGAALTLQLLDILACRTPTVSRRSIPSIALLCSLAIVLTTHFTNYPFTPDRAFAITSPDPTFFTWLPPHSPVAILTTSVDDAMMPVERYHLTWAQRTNNLWLLPAILRSETPGAGIPPARILPPATVAQLDAIQHRWMVEDLIRWHPVLILVQRCQTGIHCQELEDRNDDILAWFKRDPTFASVWSSYTYAGTRGEFDAYTLTASAPH